MGATARENMTIGCVQGSVCGPNFWNIVLDDIFEEILPNGCHLQAFADDIFFGLLAYERRLSDQHN